MPAGHGARTILGTPSPIATPAPPAGHPVLGGAGHHPTVLGMPSPIAAPQAPTAAPAGPPALGGPGHHPAFVGPPSPIADSPATSAQPVGTPIPPEPARRAFAQTVLGMAAPPTAATQHSTLVGGRTMSAAPPTATELTTTQDSEGRRRFAQTMLGISSPTAATLAAAAEVTATPGPPGPLPTARAGPSHDVAALAAGRDPAAGSAPSSPAPLAKTMLGMAPIPSPEPAGARGLGGAPPAARSGGFKGGGTVIMAAPGAAGAPAGRLAVGHRTVIMKSPVQAPPTAQGRKTLFGFRAPEPEYVEEWYDEVVSEEGAVERRVRIVERPLPPVYQRPAFWLIAGGLVLLAVGMALAVFLRGAPPLVVEPRVDAEGKDLVHVTCSSCPDGTSLAVGQGTKATVQAGAADVALAAPLAIGDNRLTIVVDRPGAGRDESVEVTVKVGFRIWPDLASLQDPVPAVRVAVEALPGSSVTVSGKPVELAADGKGSARIEVLDEVSGLSREARSLSREIAYSIASPGGSPASGKLDVKVGITPLVLQSPGSKMTTDQPTFMLAGHTAKGGGLLVAGRAISVTPDGAFAQLMNISTVGTTKVELRATSPGLAPRITTITVRRVGSLAQELRDVEAQTKVGYAELEGKDPAGTVVAWRSQVVSAAAQGHLTVAIVDVSTGCAKRPCRARVSIPGALALATGDKIFFFGPVASTVEDGGHKLPSVEAEFAVKGP